MKDTITKFIQEHELLVENSTVLIGVSGGPDSMALLHYYWTIRKQWKLNLIVICVDHQLRGDESKEDVLYVERVCKAWDIKFVGTSEDVKQYQKVHKVGVQIAARAVRYQFYTDQIDYYQADYLALGHHGDDQIETMMMSFVRSTSPKALAGIPVKRNLSSAQIVRPLLCVSKQDIIDYCQAHQINPRIDPSNEDTGYTRNYFRTYLVPLLKAENSNLHHTVQRLSTYLHADEQFLQEEAMKMVHKVVEIDKSNRSASFEVETYKMYSLALQRRAYQLILNYLYDELPESLSYAHEEIFFRLLSGDQGNSQMDFPSNLKLERSYHKIALFFLHQDMQKTDYQEILDIPGEVILPNGAKLVASYTDNLNEVSKYTYVCDPSMTALPIHIRTRKNGDRMSWKGLDGSKKLKDIFIDAKIPRKERNIWPLVTDNNGNILWLIGLRKGKQEFKTETTSYIQINYEDRNV